MKVLRIILNFLRLRDGVRALLTESLDKTLPKMLRQEAKESSQ